MREREGVGGSRGVAGGCVKWGREGDGGGGGGDAGW